MKLPPYAAYKPSGVEWLGDVPEHWETWRLKHIGRIRYGLGEPPEYADDGLPFIRATDINRGKIDLTAVKKVSPADVPWSRGPLFAKGEILIVRSGAYTGDSAIVTEAVAGCIAGYDMVLTARAAHPAFVSWALLSKYLLESQIHLARLRAAQPHLNAEELGGFTFLAPPLTEQEAIASFLDRETAKIDTLVAKKRTLIERLKEKRTALISHTVTRGLPPNGARAAGLNPHPKLKPSGIVWLGEVPVHWDVLRLSRVTVSRCDGPFGSGLRSEHYSEAEGIRVVRLQNIRFAEFDDRDAAFIEADYYKELGDHDIHPGDVLIAGLGDENNPVGRACVAPPKLGAAMVKADCFRFRLDAGKAQASFVALQLSAAANALSGALATGTTRARMNLSTTAARAVALPPPAEQAAIAIFLDRETAKIDQLIAKVEAAIERLCEYRTALITAAVTGKIDVRKAVA